MTSLTSFKEISVDEEVKNGYLREKPHAHAVEVHECGNLRLLMWYTTKGVSFTLCRLEKTFDLSPYIKNVEYITDDVLLLTVEKNEQFFYRIPWHKMTNNKRISFEEGELSIYFICNTWRMFRHLVVLTSPFKTTATFNLKTFKLSPWQYP